MKRKEFINLLGVGAGTIVVGSCLGACGKGSTAAPTPNPGTLMLTISGISTNTDMVNKGWTIQSGIIVAKNGTTYLALASACTHQGSDVVFNGTAFPCSLQTPGHGSVFNLDGTVKTGPAVMGLKKYNPVYDQASDTLKVYA